MKTQYNSCKKAFSFFWFRETSSFFFGSSGFAQKKHFKIPQVATEQDVN